VSRQEDLVQEKTPSAFSALNNGKDRHRSFYGI
jgi:hypothetical protein